MRVSVPDAWPQYPAAYAQALKLLEKQPMRPSSGWWLYLFVDPSAKAVVGSGGFKNPPDGDGVVEIGCEVARAFRRQGYATEALRGLAGYAFTRIGVAAVDAYSMPEKGAQAATLRAMGMTHIGEATDLAAGRVWHWRVTAAEFADSVLARRRPARARK